jgi:uncharacterized protein
MLTTMPLPASVAQILVLSVFCLAATTPARAADVLPPAPSEYFNDYAGVVSSGTAREMSRRLEQFERTNSSQIVVAIFPKLPERAALEDYTVRTFQHWKVGQKEKDNGAILFVFVEDRKMRLEVGYGLEGAIPDALAKRILDEQLRPNLQRGNWDAAMSAGVDAILQAARGEYRGTGRTVAQRPTRGVAPWVPAVVFALFCLFAITAARRARGTVYRRGGRSGWGGWPGGWSGGGWSGVGRRGGGGGGGFSGGGFSGGFSGGGGRSGGGGASGSW